MVIKTKYFLELHHLMILEVLYIKRQLFITYNVQFILNQFLFLKFHMYICKSERLTLLK